MAVTYKKGWRMIRLIRPYMGYLEKATIRWAAPA